MTDRPGAYGVLTGGVLLMMGSVIFSDCPLGIIGCVFTLIAGFYILATE
jgi:hypothetical protein